MDTVRRIGLKMFLILTIAVLLSASWPGSEPMAAPKRPPKPPATGATTPAAPVPAVPEPDVSLFKEATFLLPEGVRISSRWVVPPTEITLSDAKFSVDASGAPLIGDMTFSNYLVNPAREFKVSVERRISGFTHLDNGVLLLSSGNDIGLLAEPKQKTFDEKKVPVAAFQPLTSLSLKKIDVLAGAGNAAYCGGFNPQTGRYALYLLRVARGAGVKDMELVHESTDTITAVTGNEEMTFVAKGSAVVRVSRKDGSTVPFYTHPSSTITAMVITPAGLVVSTDKELVLAGENGAIEIMRSSGHRIAARGNTLYVLFLKSLGVLALDNMMDLKRFNLAVRPPAPGEVPAPIAITGVRFFESGPPPYIQQNFAESFDRENVRSLVARIDYSRQAIRKEAGQHTVTVSWYEPTGGKLMDVSYQVSLQPGISTGQLFAAIGGESEHAGYMNYHQLKSDGSLRWAWGKDKLGLRYPGQYRVLVQVDGVPAGEWFFSFTGKTSPFHAIAYDDMKMLQMLLNQGLSPRYKDKNGEPLLVSAMRFGSVNAVELLLKYGADPNDMDKEGRLPINFCIQGSDCLKKADLLLLHGLDVNVQLGKDKSPLIHYFIFKPELTLFLLKKGVDINARNVFTKQNVLGSVVGDSKLCNEEMIQLLVGRGANLNAFFDFEVFGKTVLYGKFIYTPLGYAIYRGDLDCVEVLLRNGASFSVAQQAKPDPLKEPERSALYLALVKASEGTGDDPTRVAIVRLLLKKGASLKKGKKRIDIPFDPACSLDDLSTECVHRELDNEEMLRQGEGRFMFRGTNPLFFTTADMIMTLEQDDAALDEAGTSKEPAIQELALRSHLGRVRELTAAARDSSGLYDAHRHCKEAFRIAEQRYHAMQLDVVPDIQTSSSGSQEKPILGARLLKRDEGGAYIQRLATGGPAERAGLRVGDIILALDTQKMKDADEVSSAVSRLTPGMPVRVTFLRDDPMFMSELPLTCGLLEKGMDEKGRAEMNLTRWLSANPDAPQAGEIRALIMELSPSVRK